MTGLVQYSGRFSDTIRTIIQAHVFFYKRNFYKKMSLKNAKTSRKCSENLQPRMPELQFLQTLIVPRAL